MPKKRLFKARFSGYIAILLCVIIPIFFFGIKYVLDTNTKNAVKLEADIREYHKKCAKETALAVAQNWNPGLTLTQQKDAIMKVADAVYNLALSQGDNALGTAIPGLDIKKGYKITSNSKFGGIVVTPQTIASASIPDIEYSDQTKYSVRLYSQRVSGTYVIWNPYFAMWRTIDKGTDPTNRISVFDEVDTNKLKDNIFTLIHHDIYTIPLVQYGYMDSACYPTNSYYSNSANSFNFYLTAFSKSNDTSFSYSPASVLSYSTTKSSTTNSTYKERITPSDPYCVEISISNDKIKAQTNIDIGYAVPAQCNVDIVLAIPTNGAANNIDNRDAASDTAGSPYYETATISIPTDAAKTPIYQIGQACKNFVKNNFYHIRGTNIGLIPFSAKVSISPDKISYVNDASTFVTSYFETNPLASKKMCGAALYNTRGEKYVNLSKPYVWGTELVGCPIMCRRGSTSNFPTYGNNLIAYGDLFSNESPNTTALKFQQMNLNPCYMGYSNMLSLKCDKTCTTFLPNPYYMIELTADLTKIYEMCNALYPIYDPYNVSNFIFIPVTWANNLFQRWTNNPSLSATTDQLSRPSKTTSDRKKALILLVNKPDWFEPGELTYIGFDNDCSEFPTIESDKIGFDIDYSDTSKRFLDGSNYNTNHTSGTYIGTNNSGLIAGPKKILKFIKISGKDLVRRNGFYEADDSTYRLIFPKKGLIKLVIAPLPNTIDTVWSTTIKDSIGRAGDWYAVSHNGSALYAVENGGPRATVYSSDGLSWQTLYEWGTGHTGLVGICHDGTQLFMKCRGCSTLFLSTGASTRSGLTTSYRCICSDGPDRIYAMEYNTGQVAFSSSASSGWTKWAVTAKSGSGISSSEWEGICHDGSALYAIDRITGTVITSKAGSASCKAKLA